MVKAQSTQIDFNAFILLNELRALGSDKEFLANHKGSTVSELKECLDYAVKHKISLLKNTTVQDDVTSKKAYELYFSHLSALEFEVDLLNELFNRRKKQLGQKGPQTDLKGSQVELEQLNAIAVPLFYISDILVEYYQIYENKNLIAKHQAIKTKAENYLLGNPDINSQATQSYLAMIAKETTDKLSIIHAVCTMKGGQIRDTISSINLNRIYWIYCRLTIDQTLKFIEQLHFISEAQLKSTTDFLDNIPGITFVSVFFYGVRLLVESIMLFKHSFTANNDEAKIYWGERLKREWNKRKISIINNIVWGITNFLTNYTYANLPISSQITAAIFIVDILFAKWARAEQKKLNEENIALLTMEIDNLVAELERPHPANKLHQLKLQLQIAEDKKRIALSNEANQDLILKINEDMAFLIMGSYLAMSAEAVAQVIPAIAPTLMPIFAVVGLALVFRGLYGQNKALAFGVTATAAALLFINPAIGGLFLTVMSLTAVAYSMSSKEITALNKAEENYYQFAADLLKRTNESPEACIARLKKLTHNELKGHIQTSMKKNIEDSDPLFKKFDNLKQDVSDKKAAFYGALFERTFMPLLIIVTMAISWPAGISLLCLYIASKLLKSYFDHKSNQAEAASDNQTENQIPNHTNNTQSALNAFGLFKAESPENKEKEPEGPNIENINLNTNPNAS